MNSDPLEDLLQSYAGKRLPSASGRLPSEVWAAIELRRQRVFWHRFLPILEWRELFAEPALVAAGLAIAVAVGGIPSTLAVSAGHSRLARQSLRLEMFSPAAASVMNRPAR